MPNYLLNPQHQYLKTQIETASQPQLLILLFDAAVRKLHIAKNAVLEKKIELAHTELIKVQKIFVELMTALNFDIGGELASLLFRIYEFVYHQLVKANIKQDAKLIEEVLPIVENLREGWNKAVETFLAGPENSIKPIKPIEEPLLTAPTKNEAAIAPARSNSKYPSSTPTPQTVQPPRFNLRG